MDPDKNKRNPSFPRHVKCPASIIKGLTVHKMFWTPVSVLPPSGGWCGGNLSAIWTRGRNLPGTIRLLACLGGCRLFWCSAPGAAPNPPPSSKRFHTGMRRTAPHSPLFPAGAARSIAAGVVARFPSQRCPGFRRSKSLAPGSCTETTDFPLFSLQVTGDQRQTLRLNPFGPWLGTCLQSIRREAD